MAPERTTVGTINAAEIRLNLIVALKRGWKRFRKRWRRCQERFSETAVHQCRVELRRFLSTLELIDALLPNPHASKARKNLKRFLGAFDELRDTQVQLILVGRSVRRWPALRALRTALRKREQRWIKRTSQEIERAKLGPLRRAVRALKSQLHHPASDAFRHRLGPGNLVRVLNREFSRVLKFQRRVRPGHTETIHRVRVAFKLYRYTVEAVGPFLTGVTGKKLAAMKAFQALMGQIHDAEILLSTLNKFSRKKRIDPACGAQFQDELAGQIRRLVRAYLRRAQRLERFWPWPTARKSVTRRSNKTSGIPAHPTVSKG